MLQSHLSWLSAVLLFISGPGCAFGDDQVLLGAGDDRCVWRAVAVERRSSQLLLIITLMTHFSYTQRCKTVIKCEVNVKSHFESLQWI